MDVGHQLPQISVFLAQNGLVALLEKVPMAAIPLVETHGMAREQPLHDRCNRQSSGTQQEIAVVAHQRARLFARSAACPG
jgi:hypothetical protein